MDALAPTLWLCTAMLVVAACALSAFDLSQRSYRGFRWWTGALWLNAAGAAAVALAESAPAAPGQADSQPQRTEAKAEAGQPGGPPTSLELAAAATFGSAASATDWWLGPDPDCPRRMPAAVFVTHLTTIMLGTINGTADVLGIDLDPDLPIGRAVPRGVAAD